MKKIYLFILLFMIIISQVYAAIQGNYAVSVINPNNSLQYFTVPGDATNGMYVNVKSLPTVTVVSSNQANFLATVYQTTGTNLHTVVDSGTITANQGTSPWVVGQSVAANLLATVTQGTSPWVVAGNKSHNTVVPSSTNIGTLPAISNANPANKRETFQGGLSTDLYGYLRVRDNSESILGDLVVVPRINQVEINFSSAFDSSILTIATSGTGTATQGSGKASFSSGTGVTADSSGVSIQSILYRPGHESYVYFTAAWTTPTNANSWQRIGAMDAAFGTASNGFYMGYEGTSIRASIRQNSVDTHQAFNGDPLDGSTSSIFTRAGVLEAIDFTKLNVYRIRWSWFGAAPVVWQVLSPDGTWVTFHTYRNPNTQLVPSIYQPNLFVAIDVNKASSDATNLIMTTACWAAGTTNDQIKITDTVLDSSLAKLTRSVIMGHTTAAGGAYVNVKVNPSGALTVDASDSTNVGVVGTSSDNSTNSTTKIPVINAVANVAVPTWTETNQVPLSVDLTGALRTTSALSTSPTISQIGVSNSATLIKASNTSRRSLMIRNHGTVSVYLGGSGVTISTGMILNQYDALTFDKNTAAWYGITSSGTSTVSFVEE